MLNLSASTNSLQARRERHAYSMKVCLAVIVFFAVALGLLQWSLASGPQYVVDGYPRQFVLLETTLSLIVAAYALLHLAVSGVAWALTVIRMRRTPGGKNRRPATRRNAARRMVTIG